VTSKNGRWSERVAFTEKQKTYIHGEEIPGKAERLQRWERQLKDYLHSLQGQQTNINIFKV
jgi:hypothetical protein